MIQKIYIYQKMIVALITLVILLFAFFSNTGFIKIIILPFIICTCAKLGELISILANKNKLVEIFNNIFIISFFLYYFGFLIYIIYYTIVNKEYFLIIFSIPFWFFGINYVKRKFFKD